MSLDLRSFNLATSNILTFKTKKAAKGFAMPSLCYLAEAANRFWIFFVVVRKSQNGDFHVMTKDGGFLEVPERKWLGGDLTYSE